MELHFEARELKPYAEPVSSADLREGEVYFAVNFIDDEMLIPTMETVVFAGRNLAAGDAGLVYFQDIDSYREGIRYHSVSEEAEATFQVGPENNIGHIFQYERALEQLMGCSLRRKEAGLV